MARVIQLIELEVFRKLAWKNQIDTITKGFMEKCSYESMLVGKKMNPNYFRLRQFFISKTKPEELPAFYDYLYSLDGEKQVRLYDFLIQAEEHRKKLISEAEKKKVANLNVKQYNDYGLGDIMNW